MGSMEKSKIKGKEKSIQVNKNSERSMNGLPLDVQKGGTKMAIFHYFYHCDYSV